MKLKNKISDITRQNIADEMTMVEIWYHGNQTEPDFLAQLFNLKSLPSRDSRYNNAYDDIYQHMVNNWDWDTDWIYTDPRINLLRIEDEMYLRFLSMTVHPKVRSRKDEVLKLIEIFNKHLMSQGFEIAQTGEISGRPVFSGREKVIGQTHLIAKKVEIKKYLDTDYVNNKVDTMNNAIHKDTDLAIGTAKELLETTCKSILRQKGKIIKPDWTLSKLLKTTTACLEFMPKEANDPKKAEEAIRQILGGITSIVQGVGELRNGYGTGHGKDAEFKGLEIKYARLLVSVVSEIVILYLATNREPTELIEN